MALQLSSAGAGCGPGSAPQRKKAGGVFFAATQVLSVPQRLEAPSAVPQAARGALGGVTGATRGACGGVTGATRGAFGGVTGAAHGPSPNEPAGVSVCAGSGSGGSPCWLCHNELAEVGWHGNDAAVAHGVSGGCSMGMTK